MIYTADMKLRPLEPGQEWARRREGPWQRYSRSLCAFVRSSPKHSAITVFGIPKIGDRVEPIDLEVIVSIPAKSDHS